MFLKNLLAFNFSIKYEARMKIPGGGKGEGGQTKKKKFLREVWIFSGITYFPLSNSKLNTLAKINSLFQTSRQNIHLSPFPNV